MMFCVMDTCHAPPPQVWLVILRYLAGLMAWLTILLVNVALCGVTLYCFALAGLLGNNAFGKVQAAS
jgi:hypothetical protein